MIKAFSIFCCLTPFFIFSQADNLMISRYEKFPTGSVINEIKIDPFNRIHVCTSNGLGIIGNLEDDTKMMFEGKNIIGVAFNERNGNWAADAKKIYSIADARSYELPNKDANISGMEFYNNRLFVATNAGLYAMTIATQKFELFNQRNSKLKTDQINFVYSDSKGKFWVGTSKGEVRAEKEDWQVDHESRMLTHFYENVEGLWFVSTNHENQRQEMWLIDHYNREWDAGFGPDLYRGKFNDFCIDSKGRLYFASDAFIRYDPYAEKTENYTDNVSILSQKCTSTVCDKNDNIWIGTAGDGLFRLVFKDNKEKSLSIACITEKKPSCNGKADGVVKVITNGGQGPFSYNWSDLSLKGNNPKNVAAGNYSVTVSDKIQNKQICTIEIPASEMLYVDLFLMENIKSYNGNEGRIEVKGMGGNGEYSYLWSNGSKKNYIDKLKAGNYSVTVTDKNKCTSEGQYHLTREKILPELNINNISVGKTLRINELFFKADSTEITKQSYEVLDELFTFLKDNPTVIVEIGGHTNTIPSHEYCDKLSSERAKNVAIYFYDKGISKERLSYKGYGKRKPISDSTSLDGRQKNQRVEVKIVAI